MVSKHSIHHIFGDHKVHAFKVEGTKGYFVPANRGFLKNPDAPYVLFEKTSDPHGSEMYMYMFFSPEREMYDYVIGYPSKDINGKLQSVVDETGKRFGKCA